MVKDINIRITPQEASSADDIKRHISETLSIQSETICHLRILKRSIDARSRQIYVNLTIRAYIGEEPEEESFTRRQFADVSENKKVIVVGEGPCGLFAALRLIELGLSPIILERGKNVRERKIDLAKIKAEQRVNPESNYCFGEGGAGAYSDGKLYTRSKKRGSIDRILQTFCQFGASTDILCDAHPHIGTDKLPLVIENMRNQILKSGGEVHFETCMQSLLLKENRCIGVVAKKNNEKIEIKAEAVILATGHSARDVYEYLNIAGIDIEPKGIAIGVRLEHSSHLIDQIQYHSKEGRGKFLPAAEYSFVTQIAGRGVYSFCMCPGGFIIPAATEDEQLVVNGMSPSNRGGRWSNSGMVVELRTTDVDGNDALKMMNYQKLLEHRCWIEGGRKQTAPAQRMKDFVNGQLSKDLPKTSYTPGVISSQMKEWMPKEISERLSKGFEYFGKQRRGFLTNEALMIGVETRTSAPVRILRNPETLQHTQIEGLFPAGEGAGYAGGIVSAGVDGERAAEMVSLYVGTPFA